MSPPSSSKYHLSIPPRIISPSLSSSSSSSCLMILILLLLLLLLLIPLSMMMVVASSTSTSFIFATSPSLLASVVARPRPRPPHTPTSSSSSSSSSFPTIFVGRKLLMSAAAVCTPGQRILSFKLISLKSLCYVLKAVASVENSLSLQKSMSTYPPQKTNRKAVRELWASVTGHVYPSLEKPPSPTLPLLSSSSSSSSSSPIHLISTSTIHTTDEKRLVPGGPDPLHHTNHPYSP